MDDIVFVLTNFILGIEDDDLRCAALLALREELEELVAAERLADVLPGPWTEEAF